MVGYPCQMTKKGHTPIADLDQLTRLPNKTKCKMCRLDVSIRNTMRQIYSVVGYPYQMTKKGHPL